eukprot:TRINITY_DN908_c0_g3_i1.p1 TRINITY_DN908_c0_g3~~TRINITY_DN908_c0_g3_i1.p1  ORF type:complete len:146 (+),score=20.97 TRINITY_DN908_c0_g3_i1:359-796(+)
MRFPSGKGDTVVYWFAFLKPVGKPVVAQLVAQIVALPPSEDKAANALVCEYLVSPDSSPSDADSSGQSLLHASCYAGNIALINLLLSRGAKINAVDSYGYTPLFCALANGHLAAADLLIQRGADVSVHSPTGKNDCLLVCCQTCK